MSERFVMHELEITRLFRPSYRARTGGRRQYAAITRYASHLQPARDAKMPVYLSR